MIDSDTKDKDVYTKPSGKKNLTARKYLFDHHHFDEPEKDVKDEDQLEDTPPPPPPPTFSEEEMANARRKARSEGFEEGQKQALEEARESVEQATKAVLENLSTNIKTLLSAEAERDKQFEAETLQLTRAIFAKLFPAMLERENLSELDSFVTSIVRTQDKQAEINVFVMSKLVEPLSKLINNHPELGNFLVYVKEDKKLGKGDCRIEWKNGGAIRDLTALTSQINELLNEQLAQLPNSPQNDSNHDETENVNKSISSDQTNDKNTESASGDDADEKNKAGMNDQEADDNQSTLNQSQGDHDGG